MSLLRIIMNNLLGKWLSRNPVSQPSPKHPPKKTWGFTFYGETPHGLKDSLTNLNCENSRESFPLNQFQQKLNQDLNQDIEKGLAFFPLAMSHPQPCAFAHPGDRLLIVQINGSPETQRNLIDMGLRPGKEIQLISQTDSGSTLVALGDRCLGLGATQAQQIMVTKVTLMNSQPTKIERTQVKPSDWQNQKPSPNKNICLGDLTQGAKGRVLGYQQVTRGYKGKLLAMGLTPGTEFAITRYAPLGDPVEIRVRGFSLSLRQSEATALLVEEVCE